ncbi:hypothetical protein BRYFOR_09469 [Marvinbryantia formatexigens DSM 14469]|uniref:tRNA (Uracil-5-)-methyltransferase n=1 Tax=Marvinbryantia formatexigens DSM 14469 TaxID=478749 RepID=C6LLC2_9FIRM|nr:hypothetical protein [Marvinbryantia formatexigens]EET58545.1 hypothetical protein BRYFOR_09469 [Marvinbryantia formatexigens DSM 14469]UWO24894.1 tRNA (uracil-5-)-methyltransferase [Marvinbryantia formatexigens DSM 14469]SDG77202.1 hypothetical protein SAMN05660368_03231 [Marvinbryantia formatexigens]
MSSNNPKGKTGKILLLIVLVILLVGAGVFVGLNWNTWFGEDTPQGGGLTTDENAEDWTGEQDVYEGEKNTDTIDIPGYGSITLKADSAEQSVNLYNPEQNTCYFRMTLLLSDGTQLWQSGLIEPGKGIYDITLEQTLVTGTYEDAVLKYECFAMDDAQTPLNGSEIKLTLNVIN